MSAPGNVVLMLTLLAAFVGCTGYAAGRLHQRRRAGRVADAAYRAGYDTATRSVFSLAARMLGPKRVSVGEGSRRFGRNEPARPAEPARPETAKGPKPNVPSRFPALRAVPDPAGGATEPAPAVDAQLAGPVADVASMQPAAEPPADSSTSSGRHGVPDELVRAATYRLPPDRVARAKVRQVPPEHAGEDETTRLPDVSGGQQIPRPRNC